MADLLIALASQDFPAEIPHPFYLPESAPVVLCGTAEILRARRVAMLNSRQSPRLKRASGWVEKTLAALGDFDPAQCAILTSLGTTSWDVLTWAAGRAGFPLILVFPAGSAQGFHIARTRAILEFGLDERRVLALRPVRLRKTSSADDGAARDRWILALSHRLVPISLRPGGNLENYLKHPSLDRGDICDDQRIPFEPPPAVRKPLATEQIRLPSDYRSGSYLIHWTRSCAGPYPGEKRSEYFDRVIVAGRDECDGMDTLARILAEGVIHASAHLVRGGHLVTPFTARPPQDLPQLTRWRSALRRWTFEPYGIAIRRGALARVGARPVIYGEAEEYERLEPDDQPFFQAAGSGVNDWRREEEWRVAGDVRLEAFAANEVVVLAETAVQAVRIAGIYPWRVVALRG